MINEYHFNKLIVGGSVESLLYSYYTNTKILLLNPLYPFELLTFEYSEPLKLLGYSKEDSIHQSEMWDRLSFLLSMTGLIICPNIVQTHRDSDGKFVIITGGNKRITFSSDETMYFDKINTLSSKVYDWFNVRSGNNHEHSLLRDNNYNFVKNVYFYRSKRVGGNKSMKDLVAESYIDKESVNKVEYSEGITRLKVLKMMKEAGIRGQSNGINKKGQKVHYAIKIEHTYREIKPVYEPLLGSIDCIDTKLIKEGQWNLTKKLFRHKQISTLRESFRLPAGL